MGGTVKHADCRGECPRSGHESCYVNHECRRAECREAHRKARARRKLVFSRSAAWLPVGESRRRVRALVAAGWSVEAVALSAGVSCPAVNAVLRRGATRVRYDVARKLERLQEPTAGRVPAELTHARVRSLVALGYDLRTVRVRAGLGQAGSSASWRWDQGKVERRVAEAVRALYAEVGDRPGGNARSAAYARRQGWQVPAAWDDPGTLAWERAPRRRAA